MLGSDPQLGRRDPQSRPKCESARAARILPPSADETVDMWPPLPDLDPRRRVGGGPLAGILTSFETLVVTVIEIPNVRFWPDSRGPA